MKGIVFHLFQASISKHHGEDAWDDILEEAGVEGAYTSLGTYPDDELYALVNAASRRVDRPPAEVVRWFAMEAADVFAERFPAFFAPHTTVRTFLLALNDIIHPEVKKLYPEAETPSFTFETAPDGRLVMHYHSHRQLCAFGEGLILGSAKHFGERATVEQPTCVHRGDDHCVLVVGIERAGS
ncbi:MAG: heme NO-binding domain-containing protein [Myxococcales bacterium]|nr:heme NO-binding domain-containing protein [Myxococcales bacterium]